MEQVINPPRPSLVLAAIGWVSFRIEDGDEGETFDLDDLAEHLAAVSPWPVASRRWIARVALAQAESEGLVSRVEGERDRWVLADAFPVEDEDEDACPDCGGSGSVDAFTPSRGHWTRDCRTCNGTGSESASRSREDADLERAIDAWESRYDRWDLP